MKVFYIKKTLLNVLFCLGFLVNINAQILQEIPNPSDATLQGFLGGSIENPFFSYINTDSVYQIYFHDDPDLNEIPLPSNFTAGGSGYSFQYDSKYYVSYADAAENEYLLKIDGTSITSIPVPIGYFINEYIGEVNGVAYVAVSDDYFEDNIIYAFDGNSFIALPTPNSNSTLFNYFTVKNDLIYLGYTDDSSGDLDIYDYDGTSFNSLSLPAGYSEGLSAAKTDSNIYFAVTDDDFEDALFQFDGSNLTEITIPDFVFNEYLGHDGETIFFLYYDEILDEEKTFQYDGTTITPLNTPTGIYVNALEKIFDGKRIFSMTDNSNWYIGIQDGGNIIPINSPVGPAGFIQFNTVYDEEAYFTYYLPGTTTRYLLKLESGASSFSEVPLPTGYSFDSFVALNNGFDKMFLAFQNNSTSKKSLFIYDGNAYTELINPVNPDREFFQYVATSSNGTMYFRYDDESGFGTLYIINSPVNSTSDNDSKLVANIQVSPNPATDFIDIQISSVSDLEKIDLKIFNLLGQLIIHQKQDQLGNDFKHQIDLSKMPSGQYFLYGNTPNGNVFEKLLIQK